MIFYWHLSSICIVLFDTNFARLFDKTLSNTLIIWISISIPGGCRAFFEFWEREGENELGDTLSSDIFARFYDTYGARIVENN